MKRFSTKGFTLIELLVVIAIIAILAGLILVRIGSASEEAKDARKKSDLNQVKVAIDQFRINGGSCSNQMAPHSLADANDNVFTATDKDGKYPNNYLSGDEYPKDPDDNEYQIDYSYTSCLVQLSSGLITVSN